MSVEGMAWNSGRDVGFSGAKATRHYYQLFTRNG